MEKQIQEITHTTINGKYHISIERGAVKGVLGYKVAVNSDSIEEALRDVAGLKSAAEGIAVEPVTEGVENGNTSRNR